MRTYVDGPFNLWSSVDGRSADRVHMCGGCSIRIPKMREHNAPASVVLWIVYRGSISFFGET
jgi:hypothetical protein